MYLYIHVLVITYLFMYMGARATPQIVRYTGILK